MPPYRSIIARRQMSAFAALGTSTCAGEGGSHVWMVAARSKEGKVFEPLGSIGQV